MSILHNIRRTVIVRTQLEALHNWETIPPGHPSQFLKYPHRHVFHIEVRFKVNHNDRDIEFIEMKHQLDNYLRKIVFYDPMSGVADLGPTSCEMLCEHLLNQFNHLGAFEATVLEDGEMGSTITTDL